MPRHVSIPLGKGLPLAPRLQLMIKDFAGWFHFVKDYGGKLPTASPGRIAIENPSIYAIPRGSDEARCSSLFSSRPLRHFVLFR